MPSLTIDQHTEIAGHLVHILEHIAAISATLRKRQPPKAMAKDLVRMANAAQGMRMSCLSLLEQTQYDHQKAWELYFPRDNEAANTIYLL